MLAGGRIAAQEFTTAQYREDFEYFWKSIKEDYSYWDKKETDWDKARAIYAPALDTTRNRHDFVMLLEHMFHELYDHHASLNTNTQQSSKLVPSGTDIWAAFVNGRAMVVEVKQGSGAEKAGVKTGMQVQAINGVAVEQAILPFVAKAANKITTGIKDYALRVALAGTHDTRRILTLASGDKVKDYYPDNFETDSYTGLFNARRLNHVGYIHINDDLWNNDLIAAFDSALDGLRDTRGLIIDLRNTASGGNTAVARAIIGRFIVKEGYYQRHELVAEERAWGIRRSWSEIVSPRRNPYTKPVVILVSHFTGSLGEGITIGFDALKRATIVGSEMAGLSGAVYSYRMPNTGIGFSFPVEKLYHMNGLPREQFKPTVIVPLVTGEDKALKKALQLLEK
jgi:carboxyl-terminal processing protease